MNWEAATFIVTVAVLVLQGISIYTVTRVKLWTMEHFVSKEDFWRNKRQENV